MVLHFSKDTETQTHRHGKIGTKTRAISNQLYNTNIAALHIIAHLHNIVLKQSLEVRQNMSVKQDEHRHEHHIYIYIYASLMNLATCNNKKINRDIYKNHPTG